MKKHFFLGMQVFSVCLLIALASGSFAGIDATHPVVPRFDIDTSRFPAYYPSEEFQTLDLISLNCWTDTVRDHKGEPHKNGHIIQVIADGGNGIQDPPNPDGSPGGDDTLAFGNFNLMRVCGVAEFTKDTTAQTGQFYSQKYFIPYVRGKSYYLRLWDGYNEKTAPYYQDTIEYTTGMDNGGSMIRMNSAVPMSPVDADFKFGKCKPRTVKSK
jgi:hypothetical protein